MHPEEGLVSPTSLRGQYSAAVGKVYTELAFNSHRTARPRVREGAGKLVSMAGLPSLPMFMLGSWPVACGLWEDIE